MHPTSIFPQLLFLGPMLAPLLLRLSTGIFLIYLGNDRHKKAEAWSTVIYLLAGILLVLGLYTQVAVILGILVIAFDYYTDKKNSTISKDKMTLCVIAGIILLSLLFTGPGFIAFDLPL